MRRFRIGFLLLSIVLAVPVLLLVRRALESVDVELRMRHRAVAERVFDEMERKLTDLVTREEARPFGQYGFSWAPPGQLAGPIAVTRSPLAAPPDLPFVVGYFQIDPDGSFHTPLRPRAHEAGRLEWRASERNVQTIAALEEIVGKKWRTTAVSAGNTQAAAQNPGTTVALGEPQQALERRPSAYDLLRALNRGAEPRAARQSKLSREYATESAPSPDDGDRFELSPMSGHLVDAAHLILSRTAVHGSGTYRQGLVIDVNRIGQWLRSGPLRVDGVASGRLLEISTAAFPEAASSWEDQEDPDDRFIYVHRFAEPFGALSARLALSPLPGIGDARYVHALSALVVAAGVLGLAALYRMTSVVVSFAERQRSFVAAVSHELRTPLTAIRMYGEMLRDGIVPSEAKRAEYHGHITAEAERLSRLINNVLELSRLEKRAGDVALATGQIGPVVEEATNLLRPHAEREGFELALQMDAPLPDVRFERDALLQIVFNLVDNAVKYARTGGRRQVEVACAKEASAVRLSVRDHGPGVGARDLGRIFEPFHRGNAEGSRHGRGTGLGLALVRGLAQSMGARATGRNIPGGGFEVTVVFPAQNRAKISAPQVRGGA